MILDGGEVGRRCAMGCETWPAAADFALCPTCKGPTRLYRGVHPLPAEDAKRLLRLAQFEDFYDTQWVKDETPLTVAELTKLGL